MAKPAIGIDLGTTYSAVAVYRNGNSEIIANDQGNRTTPSIVGFTSQQRIVGESAMYQATDNPENTIYGVKRLMGRQFEEESVQRDIRGWPFKVVQDNNCIKIDVQYKGERKQYFPEEISAAILEKMKNTAETYLGTSITDVVVTCPAYFNNSQRQATKDAAQIAGLNIIRMINEPTAAALAYGLNINNVGRKNVLVFDFGGGTFDVSILRIKDQEYKVLATKGDTHLGGEDIDQRMVDYFIAEFKRKNNRDISQDKGLIRNLKMHCERAKKILSVVTKAEFVLDGTNLIGAMSRARFEDLMFDLFEKAINLVDETLKDAEMQKSEINDVVLVGGSSRIPKVREMLSTFFDGKALSERVNPDEAVAMGAAIQANLLQNATCEQMKGLKLCDVCPLSLGNRVHDRSVVILIKRNSSIPIKITKNFYTVYDFQTSVDFKVYEGERKMAKDNHFLGEFTVKGIPPMPRGATPLELTYEIDENGILKATGYIPASGSTNSLTITNKSRLSKEEASRLAANAEKFRQEDQMHEERLVAFNIFEKYLYETKRKISSLSDLKQKLAKNYVETLSKWLDDNSLASKDEFEQKYSELKDFWEKLNR